MNIKQCKEYLPYVQAAAEGKTIQVNTSAFGWIDFTGDIELFPVDKLRIKPVTTFRPWTADDMPIGAVVRNKKDPKMKRILTGVDERYAFLAVGGWLTFLDLLSGWELLDGKPCGVKEVV